MSSKKSDNLAPASALHRPRWNGWLSTLLCNLPIPIILALLWWLGTWIDSRPFQREHGWEKNIIFDIGFAIILAVSLQLINGFSGQFSLGHIGFMMVGAFLAAYPIKAFSAKMTDPGPMLMFFLSLGVTVAIVGMILILLFWGIRATRKFHPTLPTILILLLFAWVMFDIAHAATFKEPPIYYIWTHGISAVYSSFNWMIEHGRTIGARLTQWSPESWRSVLCILIAMIGGASCAGVTGLIVGMPALRLRGDYLAIATLGMGEIINRIIILTPALGGALGLGGIPRIKDTNIGKAFIDTNANGRIDTGESFIGFSEFAWLYGMVIITIAVIWRLAYSAKGRAIMAVREDEIAASAVGIDTTHHKVVAFVIGAFFAGIAGALYAMQKSSIDPKSFTMTRSIEIVVMVTLGGLGSISGAILAAILLTILPELLRDPPSAWPWGFVVVGVIFIALMIWNWRRYLPGLIVCVGLLLIWQLLRFSAQRYGVSLPDLRMVIYSLMLILMMLLRPQGLLGGREIWPRRRAPQAGQFVVEKSC